MGLLPHPEVLVRLDGVRLRLLVPLRTYETDLQRLSTRIQICGVVGSAVLGV
jgi:hypothetical protein